MKVWRWLERITFVAGLLGVGIWLGSIAESALFQAWQNWSFDRQLRGQPAGFDQFLGEEKQRLASFLGEKEQRVEGFLGEEREQLVGFVMRSAQRRTAPPIRDWQPAARTVPPPDRDNLSAARDSVPVNRPGPDRSLMGRLRIPRLRVSAMVREGVGENTLRLALGHIPGTALPGTAGNVGLAGHRDTLFRPLRQIRRDDLIRLETLHGTYTYRVEKTEIVWPRNVSVLRLGDQPELTLVTCYPFYYVGAAPKRFVVRARQISATARPAPEPHQRAKLRTAEVPDQLATPPARIAPVRLPQ